MGIINWGESRFSQFIRSNGIWHSHDSSIGGPNASIVSTTKDKWSRNELAQTLSVLASEDDMDLLKIRNNWSSLLCATKQGVKRGLNNEIFKYNNISIDKKSNLLIQWRRGILKTKTPRPPRPLKNLSEWLWTLLIRVRKLSESTFSSVCPV